MCRHDLFLHLAPGCNAILLMQAWDLAYSAASPGSPSETCHTGPNQGRRFKHRRFEHRQEKGLCSIPGIEKMIPTHKRPPSQDVSRTFPAAIEHECSWQVHGFNASGAIRGNLQVQSLPLICPRRSSVLFGRGSSLLPRGTNLRGPPVCCVHAP